MNFSEVYTASQIFDVLDDQNWAEIPGKQVQTLFKHQTFYPNRVNKETNEILLCV